MMKNRRVLQPKKKLKMYYRFKFLTAGQNEAEALKKNFHRQKTLSQECELGQIQDGLLRDLIIIWTKDYRLLGKKLLSENNSTLDATIKTG